jgi:hypothetical protein
MILLSHSLAIAVIVLSASTCMRAGLAGLAR